MTQKHRFKFDKLIRDHMPEFLRSRGIDVFERTLEKEEYIQFLRKKLLEEAREVIAAKTADELLDELSDLVEILNALGSAFGLTPRQVEETRLQKKDEKGGFEKRIHNAYIEMSSDNKNISYYRARPEDYPELPL